MPAAAEYLLDTGILLHWIRASPVAAAIDAQFGLRDAGFRPLICEVTVGELAAFAQSQRWGAEKQQALRDLRQRLVTVDISDPTVVAAYAEISTLAKRNGWPILHDKNDLWIAASTRASGTTLLSFDRKAFEPLRNDSHLRVILLDAHSGERID